MSRFYKQEAKSLPKNSEAYRNLARLAAQYHDRAVANAGRASSGASDKAYNNKWASIQRQKELVSGHHR